MAPIEGYDNTIFSELLEVVGSILTPLNIFTTIPI